MRLFVDHLIGSGTPGHRPVHLIFAPLSPALLSLSGIRKTVSISEQVKFGPVPVALCDRFDLACGV
jgi:hypothetical protein